jgi:predicted signal transduction protein with EAL and GGDEF domain
VRAMTKSCLLEEQELFITTSIGIAVFPQDAQDAETLLKNADVAMYSAKRGGKNSYHFYDELMNTTAVRRLEMETYLRRALHREELSLHHQPQLDIRTQRVCGAEALLRWDNAELGSVPLNAFIPIAEESDLIVSIGEWVLCTACIQAQRWRDQGLVLPRIAVNISALQFTDKRFVAMVMEILEETGLEPPRLELTESVLMEDVDLAIEILDAFKRAGIQIAIDDVGTGYSSLSYLKRLPIDRLKIDGSFVQDIISDPDDAAIAAMARSMELDVIAEGVETEVQLEQKGRREVQGYFISRPVPVDAFEAFYLSRVPQALVVHGR